MNEVGVFRVNFRGQGQDAFPSRDSDGERRRKGTPSTRRCQELRRPFWHAIRKPIIGLSPMDGVTDPAFRFIVARRGKPDVQVTEFINVDEVCCF